MLNTTSLLTQIQRPLLIAIRTKEINSVDKTSIYLSFDSIVESIKIGDVNIDFHVRVNDTADWRCALFVNFITSIVAGN